MQSGDKGHLDGMFNDFEFEPRPELWDRIESESVAPEQQGNLAPLFAGYTHAPHSRVWRAIANQLQPGRKRRAVIWWSVAAGITLLVSLGVLLRSGQGITVVEEGAGNEWVSGNEKSRLVRDAESGREGAGAIAWRDSLQALYADGIGGCINLNLNYPWNGQPLVNDFVPSFSWYPYPYLLQHPNPYTRPFMPGGNGDLVLDQLLYDQLKLVNENSLANYDELQDSKELKEKGLASRTPDLLAMESEAGSYGLSYVDLAAVKKEKPGLETRLGSSLSPIASAAQFSSLEANDFQSQQLGTGGIIPNALADNLSSESEEVFQTPVSIGFALQWYLTGRWSLLPGLNYTRLRSEADDTDGINGELHRYTRDYLGLTASFQYDLLQRDRYEFYVTGGLQYDIGLRISDNSQTLVDGQATAQNAISGPLGNQAGASGGLGMRYKIGKRMGIYAQGTVTNYFFQSEYNLWSAKPYWPNAQVGLTLSL